MLLARELRFPRLLFERGLDRKGIAGECAEYDCHAHSDGDLSVARLRALAGGNRSELLFMREQALLLCRAGFRLLFEVHTKLGLFRFSKAPLFFFARSAFGGESSFLFRSESRSLFFAAQTRGLVGPASRLFSGL